MRCCAATAVCASSASPTHRPVLGELPLVAAADAGEVDRLLGLLVQAAGEARDAAGATSSR